MPDSRMLAELSMSCDGPLVSTAAGAGLPSVVAYAAKALPAISIATRGAMNLA